MRPAESETRRALLVVVTYRSRESLPELVASIRAFESDHINNYVAVIENSSDSYLCGVVSASVNSARVLVHEASRNDGFSHGVNLAYKLARSRWGDFDFVVLLNPDVLSAGTVVCQLVNRAALEAASAAAGVSGAVLRDQHGDIDRGCARRVWNHRRLFSHLVGYHNLTKFLGTAPRSLNQREIDHDQSELAMVSGALMCIRTDVLGDGMDTLLPMYLEDQEICMRSISMGRSVKLHPDLELVHVGAVSRKSVTAYEHALRIMELVEAPVQCMARLQGYNLLALRANVFFGGLSRLVLAAFVAAFRILFRKAEAGQQVEWMTNQQRLAAWFMLWALKGTFHLNEVSLADYFAEYSSND